MNYCKECNAAITRENCSKRMLNRAKVCDACRGERKKKYNRKREGKYNMMSIQPFEAQRVLKWLENAYFEKFGKRFRCVEHFGQGW